MSADPPDIGSLLTERQREVLAHVAAGYTSKEAAPLVDMSWRTFDKHVARICERLGVATRNEAARLFREADSLTHLLPPEPIRMAQSVHSPAGTMGQERGELLHFADAAFSPQVDWNANLRSLVPEMHPDRMGPGMRLAAMAGGAVLIAAVLIVTLGVASGLQTLLQ
jgi:DNA-binding CsgD family transcriptional regulator